MGTARPLARLDRIERIEAETKQIIDLYLELDDADAVAAALAIKPSRVRRRLHDANVSIALLRVERTVNIFRETGSVAETAARVGTSLATVRKRLLSGVVIGLLDELPEMKVDIVARDHANKHGPHARVGRRLTPELEAQTISLYQELKSLRAVGARLGLTQEGVRLRLLNAGVKLDCPPRLSDDEQNLAVQLYSDTLSVVAVAAQLRRSQLTVRKALARAGVQVRHGAWHATQREPRLQRKIGEAGVMSALYDRLGSEVAVAQILGISQTLVSGRLKLIGAAPGRGCRRKLGARNPELVEQVIEQYQRGASARQAAFAVGIQPQTALRWLRTAGFDTSKSAMFERRRAT